MSIPILPKFKTNLSLEIAQNLVLLYMKTMK